MTQPDRSRQFADLRQPEIAGRLSATSVLVQPVGAVEQHGPHLPLSTDLLIAQATAQAAVDAYGEAHDLWILPPLAYSKSNEHAWAPGTIWLSAQTLLAVLDDLGRSVASTPVRKLAFVNGHGGNSSLLDVTCRDLRLRYDLQTFLLHPSVPPDQGGVSDAGEHGYGIHGGLFETSVVLHLRPELVEMGLAVPHVPVKLKEYARIGFGRAGRIGWLANDFGPSGVIGDPTRATADLGASLFASMVQGLGEALGEVARFSFEAIRE